MEDTGCFYINGKVESLIFKNDTVLVVNIRDEKMGNLRCTAYKNKVPTFYNSNFKFEKDYHFKAALVGVKRTNRKNELMMFNEIILVEYLSDKGGMPN